jgi:membrane peptidoglycan carboxypeptidase
LSIKKSNGETIYEIEKEGKKVLSTDVARKINSILSDKKARLPAFGPNNPLQISGRTVAAKTGTTQDFRDAWTVGYTPSLATGVWAGNNDNSPMRYGAAGTYVAAPIWNKFMSEILQNNPDEKFVAYSPVSKNTPFLSGASGAKKSVSYYDKDTGKEISPEKAKKTDPKDVRTKVKVERHSLLYYLSQNKNIDPAMLRRWENALNYSSEN